MMVFSSSLGLKTAQAGITAAFIHAELSPTKIFYIHQSSCGFKVDPGDGYEYVLKLKKVLYGLQQAPHHFFNYLAEYLKKHGVCQSKCDPCLFIGKSVIVVVYVDDLLLYACNERQIDDLIAKLKDDKIWIPKEGFAEGFLGVDI
jgi:hypothetical protein